MTSPEAARLLAMAEARLATPPATAGWLEPPEGAVELLRGARSPLVLAGPGVVREGAIAGLQAFAVAGDLGVVNTWGAKGIFDWRSRHHLATVGLQADDAHLAGVPDCDLLVCTGVDDLESEPSRWRTGPTLDVPTAALAPLAEAWWRPRSGITMPPLRQRLAAATQTGWASEGAPLAPSQATRNYGEIVTAGGIVAADPGVAGFWVARTLATTRPGAVHVPAEVGVEGFAVACAVVARGRRPDLPALAVVGQLTPVMEELLELSAVPVAVEVWEPGAEALDGEAHHQRLQALVETGGIARLAVAGEQLSAMVEAAGPVTAWAGLVEAE